MDALAASLGRTASAKAVDVTMAIVGDLVRVTPVDTSQALSNWQVSINAPVAAAIPPYVPGEAGSSRAASGAEAVQVARATLSRKQPGQSIYISNVLPYIVPLNNGSSRQQPAGFVERALLIGRRVANG